MTPKTECSMCSNARRLRVCRGLCIRCYEKAARAGTLSQHKTLPLVERCTHPGCENATHVRRIGLCKHHYETARLAAQPDKQAAATESRRTRHKVRYATDAQYRKRLRDSSKSERSKDRARARSRAAREARPLDYWAWTAASSLKKKGCPAITKPVILAAYDAQQGRCAVCGEPFSISDPKARPCADHCHRSKRFRAILCFTCNVMVGNHEASRLDAAAAYVRRHART